MGVPAVLGRQRAIAGAVRGTGGSSGSDTGLMMRNQEQTYWCWAAVTEAVSRLFANANARSQCEIVTANLPEKPPGGCCGTHRNGPCDTTYRLDIAFARARVSGGVEKVVSFERLQSEIGDRQPLGIHIRWPDGSGHYIAATNWTVRADGTPVVRIADPSGPNLDDVPYDGLRTAYGSRKGSWTTTYLTRRDGGQTRTALPRRLPKGD